MLLFKKLAKDTNKALGNSFTIGKYYFSFPKIYESATQAIDDIKPGSTILFGGFGLCGIPENCIEALRLKGIRNITAVSNTAGIEGYGLGKLLKTKQIKRMVSSYVGENKEFERQFLGGELETEFIPQGTLAEKIRSGGAGIPAFYTPTGVGTDLEKGGIPIKFLPDGRTAEIKSYPKETKIFKGKKYVLEEAITGDYAIVKAQKADTNGNLVYNLTANNFNADMATAARITIAEVEEIVEAGSIPPNEIHTPGIYVDRIVKGQTWERRIEKLVYEGQKYTKAEKSERDLKREKILRRAAQEVKSGMYINLGIGVPSDLPAYLDPEVKIILQGENGILGIGNYPQKGQEHPDLINAGKESISIIKGGAVFSSSASFSMIRGHHLDLTILGAMQLSRHGDIANWIIPGKLVKGMGGAMDLLSSQSKVLVLTEHVSKEGKPKILEKCFYPLTGEGVVDQIITDMAVFEVYNKELVLKEIAREYTIDDVKHATGCQFLIDYDVKQF